MDVRELKELATKEGIEFSPNHSKKKMEELLSQNGVSFPKEEPVSSTTFLIQNIKNLALRHKKASTPVELKDVERDMKILRIKINEAQDNFALLEFLKWQRSRRLIGLADDYLLNEMSMNQISDEQICKCIRKLPTTAIHAKVSNEYKYETYYDDSYVNKATKDVGNTFYVFYVPRVISGEEQVSRELDLKIKRGFMPSREDYANDREVIHRHVLIESEFEKYFEIDGNTPIELH